MNENKKGIELTLQTIVIFIILIIVLIVILFFFSSHYSTNFHFLTNIGNTSIKNASSYGG